MSNSKPKLESKEARVRFAVRKYYLSDDDWTQSEIADELNVSDNVVNQYLNQTPHADEVKKAREAIEKEQWRQLLSDLMARLDRLAELERQLWDVVEPVVTAYEPVPAEAQITDYHLQQGGDSLRLDLAPGENDSGVETDVEIPVPAKWKEVPEFSRLRSVWDERRRTEDQLSNLLGLDADDSLHIDAQVTERKVYQIDDSGYPDATGPQEIDARNTKTVEEGEEDDEDDE